MSTHSSTDLAGASGLGAAALRAVLEGLDEAVVFLDASDRVTDVNRAWGSQLGWDSSATQGRTFTDFMIDETAPEAVAAFRAADASSVGERGPFQFRHADGHVVWMRARGMALDASDGQAAVILRDVTAKRWRGARRRATAAITTLCREASDIGDVYTGIAAVLAEHFDFASTTVELYDAAADKMTIVGGAGASWLGEPGDRRSVETCLSGLAARSGRTIAAFGGASGDPDHPDVVRLRAVGAAMYVALPLRFSDRVIGAWTGADLRGRAAPSALLDALRETALHALREVDRRHDLISARETEDRFRQITEYSSEIFWQYDPRPRRYLFIGPAFARLTGLDPDEVMASESAYEAIIYPEDRDAWAAARSAQLRGEPTQLDYRIIRPDGSLRWLRSRSFPVRDSEGALIRVSGVTFDITSSRRTEAALDTSQSRLSTILAHLPNVVIYETGGTREYISDNIRSLLGYSAKELTGDRTIFPGLIHPEDLEEVVRSVNDWHRRGNPGQLALQFRIRRSDGQYIWLDDRMFAVTPEEGPSYMTGVMLDVTDRKRAEEAMVRSGEALRRMHELGAETDLPYAERLTEMLRIGRRHFGVEVAMLTRAADDDAAHTVEALAVAGDAAIAGLEVGGRVGGPASCWSAAWSSSTPIGVEHLSEDPSWSDHRPAGVESFDGCAVLVDGERWGVLAFASSTPRREPRGPVDTDLLQLMARWIGAEIERRTAYESLQRSERRYRTLIEEAADAVFLFDAEGRVLDVNPSACRLLRDERERLLGLPADDILLLERDEPARLSDLGEGDAVMSEGLVRRRDGGLTPVEVSARGVDGGRRQAFVRDITERKRVEQSAMQTQITLARLHEAAAMPGGVAERVHELLRIGCTHFGVEIGGLTRLVDEATCELEFLEAPPEGPLEAGSRLPRDVTYCEHVVRHGRLIAFEHASAGDWADTKEFRSSGLEAYIGSPVLVAGTAYGTLFFASRRPRNESFAPVDHERMLHMAQWVSSEIEREQSIAALRASESRFRAVFDQAGVAMVMAGRDGALQRTNPGLRRMLGYATEELMAQTLFELVVEADVEDIREQFARVVSGEISSARIETRFRRKDEQIAWGLVTVSASRDDHGDFRFVIAIIEDVTARKEAEQALVEREERFRLVSLATRDAIYDWDLRQNTVWRSVAYRQSVGEPDPDEHQLDWWRRHVHPEDVDRVTASIEDALRSGADRWAAEYRFRRDDEGWAYFVDHSFIVRDEAGAPIRMIGAIGDITARKVVEEELRRRNKLERLLFRELDHRVRNNLTALVGLIDMGRKSTHDLDEFASTVRRRITAMATIHTALSQAQWRSIQIHRLLESVLPLEAAGRIDVDGPPIAIAARQASALAMVFHELLTNSVKHGSLSGTEGRIAVTWRVVAERDDETDIELRWVESGGPPIETPPDAGRAGTGAGAGLIIGFTRSELQGEAELGFPRGGARHRFLLRLENSPVADRPGDDETDRPAEIAAAR